jgi:hypothetical protein
MAKIGKSLQELAIEIDRQSKAKRDYVANATALALRPAEGGVVMKVGDLVEHSVGGLAHGQIAEYTDIPKAYYDRMLQADPGLLATNVNHWMVQKSDKRMVRTLDGKVRALLSDRYRPLENAELAEAVLPVLQREGLILLSCEITERRLYIKAVDERILRDVPSGRKLGDGSHVFFDTVSPAVTISNSEVGCGAVFIESGVFTKACTNLAMVGNNMRKYHTGARAELSDDVFRLLSDDTRRKTDAAVWAQVRDVVAGALNAARFEALCDKLGETSEQKIEGSPVAAVEVLGKTLGMGKGETNSVLKHLIEGGDLTRYGLFNAVTRTAEDLPDYDRATEFERFGGRVIELPRNDWERIAKAA